MLNKNQHKISNFQYVTTKNPPQDSFISYQSLNFKTPQAPRLYKKRNSQPFGTYNQTLANVIIELDEQILGQKGFTDTIKRN